MTGMDEHQRRLTETRRARFRRELNEMQRLCVEASLERKGWGRPNAERARDGETR